MASSLCIDHKLDNKINIQSLCAATIAESSTIPTVTHPYPPAKAFDALSAKAQEESAVSPVDFAPHANVNMTV